METVEKKLKIIYKKTFDSDFELKDCKYFSQAVRKILSKNDTELCVKNISLDTKT